MTAPDREQLEILLSAYLDGELDAARRSEVEALLQRDADARGLLADLKLAAQSLAALPRARATDELMDRLRERMERAALLGEDQAVVAARSPRRWLLRGVSAAAVIGLTLLGGYLLLPGGDQPAAVHTLARHDAASEVDAGRKVIPGGPLALEGPANAKPVNPGDGLSALTIAPPDEPKMTSRMRAGQETDGDAVVTGVPEGRHALTGSQPADGVAAAPAGDASVVSTDALSVRVSGGASRPGFSVDSVAGATFADELKANQPAEVMDEVVLELAFADQDQLDQAVAALRREALPPMTFTAGVGGQAPPPAARPVQSPGMTGEELKLLQVAPGDGPAASPAPTDANRFEGEGVAGESVAETEDAAPLRRREVFDSAGDRGVILGARAAADVEDFKTSSPHPVSELTIQVSDQASLERAAQVLADVQRQAAGESWYATATGSSTAITHLQKEVEDVGRDRLPVSPPMLARRVPVIESRSAGPGGADRSEAANVPAGGDLPVFTPNKPAAAPESRVDGSRAARAAASPAESPAAELPARAPPPAPPAVQGTASVAASEPATEWRPDRVAGAEGRDGVAAKVGESGGGGQPAHHPLHPAQMATRDREESADAGGGSIDRSAGEIGYRSLFNRIGELLHPLQSAVRQEAPATAPAEDQSAAAAERPRLRLRLMISPQLFEGEAASRSAE